MRRWLASTVVGVALLLLIPVFVVFTPPVRHTWDPERRPGATAERDTDRPDGRGRARAGVPDAFIGSIVTRTALEVAMQRMPVRQDGEAREWSYAVAGSAWTGGSPLEMSVTDARPCVDGATLERCRVERTAFAHARVTRAGSGSAEVEVTWRAAPALGGVLGIVLVNDAGVWRVREVSERSSAAAP
jgi:hypothetical protein